MKLFLLTLVASLALTAANPMPDKPEVQKEEKKSADAEKKTEEIDVSLLPKEHRSGDDGIAIDISDDLFSAPKPEQQTKTKKQPLPPPPPPPKRGKPGPFHKKPLRRPPPPPPRSPFRRPPPPPPKPHHHGRPRRPAPGFRLRPRPKQLFSAHSPKKPVIPKKPIGIITKKPILPPKKPIQKEPVIVTKEAGKKKQEEKKDKVEKPKVKVEENPRPKRKIPTLKAALPLRRDGARPSYGAPAAPSYSAPAKPQVIIKEAGPSQQYGWVGHGKHAPYNVPNPFPSDLPRWIPMGNNVFEAGLLYPGKPGSAPAPATYSPPATTTKPTSSYSPPATDPPTPSYSVPKPAAPASPSYTSVSAPSSYNSGSSSAPSNAHAPAPVFTAFAPAPAPASYSSAPAPAPASYSSAPAPAPSTYNSAPAPAPAFTAFAPAPAPASYNSAPAPAPVAPIQGSYVSISQPSPPVPSEPTYPPVPEPPFYSSAAPPSGAPSPVIFNQVAPAPAPAPASFGSFKSPPAPAETDTPVYVGEATNENAFNYDPQPIQVYDPNTQSFVTVDNLGSAASTPDLDIRSDELLLGTLHQSNQFTRSISSASSGKKNQVKKDQSDFQTSFGVGQAFDVPLQVEETFPTTDYFGNPTEDGNKSPNGDPEVFYIFYENEDDTKPVEVVKSPQPDTSGLIIAEEPANSQFSPPDEEDIRTIYVPFENAINIPQNYELNLGTSFGYDKKKSKGRKKQATSTSYTSFGFPNFPGLATRAPPSYDNPISSYDAPIYNDGSYTAEVGSGSVEDAASAAKSPVKQRTRVRQRQRGSQVAAASETVYSHNGRRTRVRKVRKPVPVAADLETDSSDVTQEEVSATPFGTRIKRRKPYHIIAH